MVKAKFRYLLPALLCIPMLQAAAQQRPVKRGKTGYPALPVHIRFINTVNHQPLVLQDSVYTNPFGENYTVSRFKYYISNIELNGPKVHFAEKNSYHLLDAQDSSTLQIRLKPGRQSYTSISFLIGVDSARNVSGIQGGDLDPAKDMFWTWKSGYIMAKLEGRSPLSTAPNQRIEYHIGGYGGEHNSIRKIMLLFPEKDNQLFVSSASLELEIEADIQQWWNSSSPLRIKETPVCAVPGEDAKRIADNYANLFSLKSYRLLIQ